MTINIPIDGLSNYIRNIVKEELKEIKSSIFDEIDDLKYNVVKLQDDLEDIDDIANDMRSKAVDFNEARDELADLFTDMCNTIISKLK